MNSLLWWPQRLNKYFGYYAAVLSGILLSGPWVHPMLWPLVFVGMVPLLCLAQWLQTRPGNVNQTIVNKKGKAWFWYVYLAMFVFNLLSTWWVSIASIGGGAAAVIFNALFMVVPWLWYRGIKLRFPTNQWLQGITIVGSWVSFEFLHMNWDLTWSWLNLGNALAFAPLLAQWYSYTGALGGTVWIVAINLLVYKLITTPNTSKSRLYWLPLVLTIGLPCFTSYCMHYLNPKGIKGIAEVVVVQPNIDPYTEKFQDSPTALNPAQQVERFISLSNSAITPKTRFLLWPETALVATIDENNLASDPTIIQLQAYVNAHPGMLLLTGANTFRFYTGVDKAHKPTRTARFSAPNSWYDVYNTGISINPNQAPQLYHKSKLVPGVEQMPYPEFFGFLDIFSIDLGGISGSVGTQPDRVAFKNSSGSSVAPVICYESIYGAFCTNYINKGANFIGIITNDGWWGNTPGYKQHWAYASLRAIETGRWVARSANTGISGFINAHGEELQSLPWATQGTLSMQLPLIEGETFYTIYKDWLAYPALLILIASLIVVIVIKKKKQPGLMDA